MTPSRKCRMEGCLHMSVDCRLKLQLVLVGVIVVLGGPPSIASTARSSRSLPVQDKPAQSSTELVRAVRGGELDRARALLQQGADPNVEEDGFTSLMWAISQGFDAF